MLEMKRKIIVSEIKKEELRKKLGDFKFEVLQRIWDAYNYLLEKDEVKNVKDLAFNLNRDYTNVNAIINGIRSKDSGFWNIHILGQIWRKLNFSICQYIHLDY